MASVQQAANAVVSAPTDVAQAGISTIQAALDSVKDLVDSAEASADQVLEVVKKDLPGLEEPFLNLLHLSVTKQPGA